MIFVSIRTRTTIVFRKRRNWWRLLYALIISVLYQLATHLLGWTHETNWSNAIINGALIWTVLSAWFVITGVLSVYLPQLRRWWWRLVWLVIDWLIHVAALLATGWLFQLVMQLTGTSAPGGWWLYTLIAIPHIITGWELRRQINRA